MEAVHLKVAATLMFATFGVAMALATFTGTALGGRAPVETSAIERAHQPANKPEACKGQAWPHYNAACVTAISSVKNVREVRYAERLVQSDATRLAFVKRTRAIQVASR